MTFRPANEHDLAALVELRREFCEHENIAFRDEPAREAMRRLVTEGSLGRLLVIEDGGAIVGYLAIVFGFSLEFRGRDAFVDELYVVPAARGKGLGTAALRAAEEACVAAGVKALHLEVARTNEGARALYLRNGFFDRGNYLLSKHLASRAIETARLRLRPATAADVDVLHRLWTDPDVRRYLWDDRVIERDVAAAVVEASGKDWDERGYGLWVVEEGGAAVGFAGFRSSEDDPRPELLFGFLPSHWHRGLATEAANAALDYAAHILRCDAVWGATDPPNEASVRVMKRAGMVFERRGTLNGLETLFYVKLFGRSSSRLARSTIAPR